MSEDNLEGILTQEAIPIIEPPHILLVDNAPGYGDLFNLFLSTQGYRVSIRQNPDKAMLVIMNEPVDLLLVDNDLLRGRHANFVFQAKDVASCLGKNMPVVVMLTYSSHVQYAQHAYRVVRRPDSREQMMSLVNDVIEKVYGPQYVPNCKASKNCKAPNSSAM